MLVCCMGGAIVYIVGLKVSDPSFFDLSLVPSNLLLIHAWGVNDHPGLNGPSWSLSAEAFVYILFPLLALLLARTGPVVTIAVAVVITAVTAFVRDKAGLGDASLATYDFGNLRALPAFLAGMATCTIVNRLPRRRIDWWIPNVVAVVVVASMLMAAPVSLILCFFPLLVGLVAMAERGGAKSMLASPFFVLLGNASFAIYLTHTYFQVVSVSVVRIMGWTSLPALTGVSLVFYAAIVGSGVLSYLYFETPMRKALIRHRPFASADPTPYRTNSFR